MDDPWQDSSLQRRSTLDHQRALNLNPQYQSVSSLTGVTSMTATLLNSQTQGRSLV